MLTKHVMMKDVVTEREDASIQQCIELLFKRHVGSVIIVSQEQYCIGIFTERDAIRVVAQKIPLEEPIRKVMTKNVITVDEDSTYEEAKKLIKHHGIRHLPVVDSNKKLVGLVSVRHILTELSGL